MALISTKNLVAPLTNKVHLTSLILLAVAFAAIRFAGGSVAIERNAPNGRLLRSEETRRVAPAPSNPEQTRRGVNNLRNSIGTVPPDRSEDSKKQGGLAEIEKSLGL